MTNIIQHPAIVRYLARFDEEAKVIGAARRLELREEIESHLTDALETNATTESIAVVLDQLGTPAEIISQELDSAPTGQSRVVATTVANPAGRILLLVIAAVAVVWLLLSATPFVFALSAPLPTWLLTTCAAVIVVSVSALVVSIRRLRRK